MEDVYRMLYNPNLYLRAYARLHTRALTVFAVTTRMTLLLSLLAFSPL
ncbi:MAG: hypothetical protein J2P36_00780 [Ktedonobacteraceae bacterium]|nr:hypothetical protein [Ktedonobacteraceae bacterium]